MTKLSIVIPVYNSEKTIGYLCERLIELYAEEFRLEIILVNDGSKDNSDNVCRRMQSKYNKEIIYIKLAKNFGEHNALMAGLNFVTGTYCVEMDDDLQNPPEEVIRLVNEIKKGYDVVYTFYEVKHDSFFRNLGSRFNDKIANVILRKPAGIYLSSFKILNQFMVNEIIKYTGSDPYIDGIILRSTDNIGRIEVGHKAREHDKSGYTMGKLVSLWGNMVVNFSMLPLRLLGLIGLVLIVYGFGYGFYKAYDDFLVAGKLTEYETLMAANMVFRGVVLLAVGVLGEYVGRIYMKLNRSPQFIVRDIVKSRSEITEIGDIHKFAGRNERRRT